MIAFDEGKQRVTFDGSWQVAKYDDSPRYRKGIAKLDDTKAVDFVGLRRSQPAELHWIEVKDFRGYRIQNKHRISDGALALEVGMKVRDSIAGVVGTCVKSQGANPWKRFVRAMQATETRVKVLLCLEDDSPPGPIARRKVQQSVLLNQIKTQLAWLTPRVELVNRDRNNYPPGLEVMDLPGASQP